MDQVLIKQQGAAGILTLNRPEALNALTRIMVDALADAFDRWADDHAVTCVILRGAGTRAFSPGGDLRMLHDWGRAGDPRAAGFVRAAYSLMARIRHYPKPVIALMDGIAMGGGAGLGINAQVSIGTERLDFAMPECGIGLIPDAGASHFFARSPGETGMFLALTGTRLGAADALYARLIDYHVPRAALAGLTAALADGEPAETAARRLAEDPGAPALRGQARDIDELFAGGTIDEIIPKLAVHGSDWAKQVLGILAKKSPTSLKLTAQLLRRAQGLSLNDALKLEYRLATRLLEGEDLYQGIRAVVIDKQIRPRWQPPALDDVREETIDGYFAPRDDDLVL